jgi:X-Pro dipeptidyl-peptidase
MYSPKGNGSKRALVVTLVVTLMAGVAGCSPKLRAQAQERAGPVFEDVAAQIVAAFEDPERWVRHDLWVETEFDSDGDGRPDRVHVDVTRPVQTDDEGLRVPVIYESSPYYSGTGSLDPTYFWNIRQEVGQAPPRRNPMPAIEQEQRRPTISDSHVARWVPRGFAVVHSESPGTGLSEGCPTVGGMNEALAPKAVIDWLNGRARGFRTADGEDPVEAYWSTGRVGMTGTSYNAAIAVAAATTGVEGLEVIIPVAAPTSYYDYYRSNGLVRSPGGYPGEDIDVLYDFINSGDPDRRDYCNQNVRDGELSPGQDRVTGDYNAFWATRDYLGAIDRIRAAVFVSHGFNDWNVMPSHSYRLYDLLKARGTPAQVFYHQDGHGASPPIDQMNRWFTRYLYGVENGVEEGPRAWIVREGADRSRPTPYPDYPHPDAAPVRLHPRAGGRAIGALEIEERTGRGTEGFVDDVSIDGAGLARLPSSPNRLLYATPVLTRPVHVSGLAQVSIRMAATRAGANLSVWLVSLPWIDGGGITDNLITRGWADPQNHRSVTEGQPLVPGEFYDLSFSLQPDDQVIPAGQRIGLMIFSSDSDFTLHPEPGTELRVDLEATSLELPVVGGPGAFTDAVSR